MTAAGGTSTSAVVGVGELLLGVDLGTSSSKAVLASPDGEVVASAHRDHAMSLPRPGWAEVDAERTWWQESVSLIRELVDRAAGDRIVAACVTGVGPCLLLCDKQMRPVRPAILYGIDTRATHEIEELTARYGAAEIVARGGKPLSSQAVGPKLAWVRKHEPQAWARSRRCYGSSSFVAARLTGAYVLDHHTASQFDPLYDLPARSWNLEWAGEVCGDLPLPRLVWPSDVVGTVTAEAAAVTGLPEGLPVSAGTVDAWAEAFSAGVRSPGDVMLMYGSTMFLVEQLAELRTQPPLWTTNGVEPGTYTLAGGTATAGTLLGWLRTVTGGGGFEEVVAEAARVPAGSDGLVVLPYLAGERSPIFDCHARGLFAGMTLRHTRGHLFRAAYEGIAFGIRQIVELLDGDSRHGRPPHRLVAVGGGTQGGLWPQIVSDVCGLEQVVPRQTIGASYGAALLAAIGTGLVPPHTDWAVADRLVTPDPANRERYDRLFETFVDLYISTREQMHRLAGIQEAAADL
jgi:xylulokinase